MPPSMLFHNFFSRDISSVLLYHILVSLRVSYCQFAGLENQHFTATDKLLKYPNLIPCTFRWYNWIQETKSQLTL